MNWHQMAAARRSFRTRNMPAHIHHPEYPGKMLCGISDGDAEVYLEPAFKQNREKPENKCCAKCKRVAEKIGYDALVAGILTKAADRHRRDGQFGLAAMSLEEKEKIFDDTYN